MNLNLYNPGFTRIICRMHKTKNFKANINNGMLKGIGYLNTVISGKPIDLEIKGRNESVKLGNQQIPRMYANGNTLPPVVGEGWGTRLALIKAPNAKIKEEQDRTIHSKISQGDYNLDLEWLVYNAIKSYWELGTAPIINQKMEDQQDRDYAFQSYPEKLAIEALVHEDYEDGNV